MNKWSEKNSVWTHFAMELISRGKKNIMNLNNDVDKKNMDRSNNHIYDHFIHIIIRTMNKCKKSAYSNQWFDIVLDW